jgi:hypothetical protein
MSTGANGKRVAPSLRCGRPRAGATLMKVKRLPKGSARPCDALPPAQLWILQIHPYGMAVASGSLYPSNEVAMPDFRLCVAVHDPEQRMP